MVPRRDGRALHQRGGVRLVLRPREGVPVVGIESTVPRLRGERRFREVPGSRFRTEHRTGASLGEHLRELHAKRQRALPRVGGVNLQEERAFVPQV